MDGGRGIVPHLRIPTRRHLLLGSGAAAALPLLSAADASPAGAQGDYPARPVRVIVPYPAGGAPIR